MAESSTRKARCIKKDLITELPRNLKETILCFMPIQDAVRTSILSRKWRHCWTGIPHLNFDEKFSSSLEKKFKHYANPELRALKFVSVINKCLLLHNGPILKFSYDFPDIEFLFLSSYDEIIHDQYNEIIHDHINQWFSFLSKNGIKQLILVDSELRVDTAHHFTSLDLTHLRLLSVWFSYTPAYGRFTYLTNLELVAATSNFGHGIFDCPVLEKLTLIICEGLFHTNFRAPNLKCLHQIYGDIHSGYPLYGLENLTDFSFMLTRDSLTMETKTLNVVQVLGSLPKIEKFSVGMSYMKYLAAGGSPKSLCKSLTHLKTLNISDIDFSDLSEVSCLLCMIRSAPNLCELHISGTYDRDEENPKNYWVEDSEDCTTIDQLKIVTFSNLEGNIAELELVKFLLCHSPLLKTLFIHHISTIEKDVALAMAKKMLEYSRASSRAQIRYLKDIYEMDGFDFELWSHYDINC